MMKKYFNKELIFQQIILLVLMGLGTVVAADRLLATDATVLLKVQKVGSSTVSTVDGLRCLEHWQIADVRWYHLFFFSDAEKESVMHMLFLLFILFQGFLITRKLNPKDLFSANIAGHLHKIAAAIMILYLADLGVYLWMKDYVAEMSKEAYKISRDMRLAPWVIFAGLGFQWLGNLVSKGYKLQQEQNLTI